MTHDKTPPRRLRLAQLLLGGPLGLMVCAAALAFTAAAVDDMSAPDYVVAVWAVASGALNVVVATRLRRHWPGSRRIALVAGANYTAFSLVKLIAYGEGAALVFLALGALAMALVAGPRIPGRPRLGYANG